MVVALRRVPRLERRLRQALVPGAALLGVRSTRIVDPSTVVNGSASSRDRISTRPSRGDGRGAPGAPVPGGGPRAVGAVGRAGAGWPWIVPPRIVGRPLAAPEPQPDDRGRDGHLQEREAEEEYEDVRVHLRAFLRLDRRALGRLALELRMLIEVVLHDRALRRLHLVET